jgi:hypothetical protein
MRGRGERKGRTDLQVLFLNEAPLARTEPEGATYPSKSVSQWTGAADFARELKGRGGGGSLFHALAKRLLLLDGPLHLWDESNDTTLNERHAAEKIPTRLVLQAGKRLGSTVGSRLGLRDESHRARYCDDVGARHQSQTPAARCALQYGARAARCEDCWGPGKQSGQEQRRGRASSADRVQSRA